MYGPLNLQAAVDRILATLDADTPTLATVNTNVTALGTSTRLGNIKGVDRGTITLTAVSNATATVGAVVLARSQLSFLGLTASHLDHGNRERYARIELSTTTTVKAIRIGTSSETTTCGYELTEYNS